MRSRAIARLVTRCAQASLLVLAAYLLVSATGACGSGDDVVPAGPGPGDGDPLGDEPPAAEFELDGTVATDFADATEFLYTGEDPVQTGVAPGTIDRLRVAVLRGRVLDAVGGALEGAAVTVLGHGELGQTLTQADGWFDLAVNGGGMLTVTCAKAGYLPAQRHVNVPWREWTLLPDVVLTEPDSAVTVIDLSAGASAQAHRASVVTDGDGTRQATLIFPEGGNTATFRMPDGSTRPAGASISVRATEYTVGDMGPDRMPGELPPSSSYTYSVELTVDQAEAVGASSVEFATPVAFYLENFLGFSGGTQVPTAYYDRSRGVWVPVDDGQVVEILGMGGGLALLDLDGDGMADDAAAAGIPDAERAKLATLYGAGVRLWRVAVSHFTPYDCNFARALGIAVGYIDAPPPDLPEPVAERDAQVDMPAEGGGYGRVAFENQVLYEDVGVVGTDLALHYASDRVQGRSADRTLTIPISGGAVTTALLGIELEIEIAGRRFTQSFPAQPNQRYRFEWDGRDAYGRTLQGEQPVDVRLRYDYLGTYAATPIGRRTFALLPTVSVFVLGRDPVSREQRWRSKLGGMRQLEAAVGGLGLTPHHIYDPYAQVLYRGDGSRRVIGNLTGVLLQVADASTVLTPLAVLHAPDGSLLVADTGGKILRHIARDGTRTTIAGLGFGGDGGPAADAALGRVTDMAFGPDGSLYLVDTFQFTIRRIDRDGIIRRVAGNGSFDSVNQGDGGPATAAPLGRLEAIAVGSDGSLYFTCEGAVRKVSPDGYLATVATRAQLGSLSLSGLAVGPEGSVYVTTLNTSVLWRLTPFGERVPVAGGGADGVGAIDGRFGYEISFDEWLEDVEVMADGRVVFCDRRRVYELTSEGLVRILVGPHGRDNPCAEAVPPEPVQGAAGRQRACFAFYRLAGRPDGRVTFSQEARSELWRLESPLPGYEGEAYLIAAEDGTRVFAFDAGGRHLRTVHALTGATLWEFGYDPNGRLVTVTDGDGNVTTVERDGSGKPTAIVAPFGQRTTLTTNGKGYVDGVTNPAGETTSLAYAAGGLLTRVTGARGVSYDFTYGPLGRLIRAQDPTGAATQLARADIQYGHQVVVTSPEGRTTTYRVERLADGSRRRTTIYPDGTSAQLLAGRDGSKRTLLPSGMVFESEPGADPRFGMQAAFAKWSKRSTPGGLERVTTASRAVVLTDPANLFSLDTLTETLSVNGRTRTATYLGATRTWTRTSPEGREALLAIDSLGRPTLAQVDGLEPTTFTYDARGRPAERREGTGGTARVTSYGYDSSGWLERITDPLGRTVDFARDLAGRVTGETRPDGRVVGFGYDVHGNLTSLMPPGRGGHGLPADDRDQLAIYAPPTVGGEAADTTFTYDDDRAPAALTHSDGRSIQNGYDAAGRLSTVAFSAGTVTYGYAAGTGLLTSLAAPLGDASLAYAYDGGLPKTTTWSGAVAGSVGRTYDSSLRLMTFAVNGAAVGYTYDDDDNVTAVGSLTLAYDPTHGLLTGTSQGSVTENYTYTDLGEVSRHTAKHGTTTLLDLQYTYDPLGRVTKVVETVGGSTRTIEYGYDAAGRLLTVDLDSVRQVTYAYDSNGNRASATTVGGTVTGTYDARDRMTKYDSADYTYRASGELGRKTAGAAVTDYAYDERGNLRAVTLPSGTQIDYAIDGVGRRVGKDVGGTRVQGFLYADRLSPVAELDASNNVVSVFDYASRAIVPDTMIRGGTTYRILCDHLGSVRLVVNAATGAIAQRLDYDAFGVVTQDTNPGFQPFGFAGGLYDKDTGLVRLGARDYDPASGRFTARDPILFAGTQANLYAYVGGDPVNLVDPSGLGPEGRPAPPPTGMYRLAVRLEGDVQARYQGSDVWIPIQTNRRLKPGDLLRTLDGSAKLQTTGGATMLLGPNTTVSVDEFNVARQRIHRNDSVLDRIKGWGGRAARYQVPTLHGDGARG